MVFRNIKNILWKKKKSKATAYANTLNHSCGIKLGQCLISLRMITCLVYIVDSEMHFLFCKIVSTSVLSVQPTEMSRAAGALFSVLCTVYSAQFTLYTVHCKLYTVHCTLYSVHCALYTVHCILYSVHCTLYSVYQSVQLTNV